MISHQELHDLMCSRRSVRRFRAEEPPAELIESILASAVTAPSASNKQPWRFIVLRNREMIVTLASRVRAAVDRIASAIDPPFAASFRAYGDYFTRFENAPVVIVALFRSLTLLSNLTDQRLSDDDAQRIRAMERDSGLIGTSMAMENLLLAAHAAGLGASGMTGPLVAVDAIREIAAVPPSWEVAALIPIGFPDESPVPTTRKPAEKVTQWID
jgi:nitroreductase